ncbi:MAG: acylphosphatase [Oscillospiraceae bacterium]|nr:acylphosphatase [Oscillospiraceae bacterium]
MADGVIRKRLVFSGIVQGVGFRWRARHAAEAVGATGWVRNDWSGTVTMELQGTEAQIAGVLAALERGAYIRIESIEARRIPTEENERGFRYADGY